MSLFVDYAIAGVFVAFAITTIDLGTPKSSPMGVRWTLFFGAIWPVFLVIVAISGYRMLREKVQP